MLAISGTTNNLIEHQGDLKAKLQSNLDAIGLLWHTIQDIFKNFEKVKELTQLKTHLSTMKHIKKP